MTKLDNPYLIRFEEWFFEGSITCIITEYCKGGDLANRIREKQVLNDKFTEDIISNWTNELINAVHYLHNNDILKCIHRDIKPGNVFLTEADHIKLGDMGVSRTIDDNSTSLVSTYAGTFKYMSPEIKKKFKYTFNTDCWSIGCILFELLTLNIFDDYLNLNNFKHEDIDKIVDDLNISSLFNKLLKM